MKVQKCGGAENPASRSELIMQTCGQLFEPQITNKNDVNMSLCCDAVSFISM